MMSCCPCYAAASPSFSLAEAPRRRGAARSSASPRVAASPGEPLNGSEDRCKVLPVGHSTRPMEAFIEMLAGHGVTQLIDVRTVPNALTPFARVRDEKITYPFIEL